LQVNTARGALRAPFALRRQHHSPILLAFPPPHDDSRRSKSRSFTCNSRHSCGRSPAPAPDLFLGHASILTTERYDNQTLEALQAAALRLEAGKTFDTNVAPDRFQGFFKIRIARPSDRTSMNSTTRPLSEGPNMKKAPANGRGCEQGKNYL
jgi:hypothetical protein